MKHAQKEFTLIEIMIVVAIIAILSAVANPNFIKYRATAQQNSCQANKKSILVAIEAYSVASNATPATINIQSDLLVRAAMASSRRSRSARRITRHTRLPKPTMAAGRLPARSMAILNKLTMFYF